MKHCAISSNWKMALACALAIAGPTTESFAAAYASGITFVTPTQVSFTLNEPADLLTVSINGGAPITLDPTTSGTKTFSLNSPSDKFSIVATKNDPFGYTIPTGSVVAASTNGLSQPTNAGGFHLISDDSTLMRFNSPRGVTVATNPNNPQFGTAYISNSAAGTNAASGRTLGDGIYALKADRSDAFGYGDIAQANGLGPNYTTSASSPFRLTIGPDHNVYVADFSDSNGSVYRMNGTLTTGTQILAGVGGPTSLPAGQNHGSSTAVFVSGSATGTLSVYTLDEDLTSSQFTPGASTTDKNSIWRYDFDAALLPAGGFAGNPTKVNLVNALQPLATSDLDVGANGKFYAAQNRLAGTESGLFVFDLDGSLIYSSLTASRTLLGDLSAPDILRNVLGIAVSPDQKWIAAILNNSDVAVIPLDANGLPLLENRLIVDTGTDINSGRDIAFDAAGNIHYVSSGQGLYRVLAPGGMSQAVTSWDGSSYSFAMVPEPSTAAMLGAGLVLSLGRRRRA